MGCRKKLAHLLGNHHGAGAILTAITFVSVAGISIFAVYSLMNYSRSRELNTEIKDIARQSNHNSLEILSRLFQVRAIEQYAWWDNSHSWSPPPDQPKDIARHFGPFVDHKQQDFHYNHRQARERYLLSTTSPQTWYVIMPPINAQTLTTKLYRWVQDSQGGMSLYATLYQAPVAIIPAAVYRDPSLVVHAGGIIGNIGNNSQVPYKWQFYNGSNAAPPEFSVTSLNPRARSADLSRLLAASTTAGGATSSTIHSSLSFKQVIDNLNANPPTRHVEVEVKSYIAKSPSRQIALTTNARLALPPPIPYAELSINNQIPAPQNYAHVWHTEQIILRLKTVQSIQSGYIEECRNFTRNSTNGIYTCQYSNPPKIVATFNRTALEASKGTITVSRTGIPYDAGYSYRAVVYDVDRLTYSGTDLNTTRRTISNEVWLSVEYAYCRFSRPGYWEHINIPNYGSYPFGPYLNSNIGCTSWCNKAHGCGKPSGVFYTPLGGTDMCLKHGGNGLRGVIGPHAYCNAINLWHVCSSPVAHVVVSDMTDRACSVWPYMIRPAGHGCFAPDTRILLADGHTISADKIRVGDIVYNPVTRLPAKVRKVVKGPEKLPLIEIVFGGKRIRITQGHPVLTYVGVKPAAHVRSGDFVIGYDGDPQYVESTRKLPVRKDQQVFNFELDTSSDDTDDHMVLSDGIVTGDLWLQNSLPSIAPSKKPPRVSVKDSGIRKTP